MFDLIVGFVLGCIVTYFVCGKTVHIHHHR